jgi:hypothetical protein
LEVCKYTLGGSVPLAGKIKELLTAKITKKGREEREANLKELLFLATFAAFLCDLRG